MSMTNANPFHNSSLLILSCPWQIPDIVVEDFEAMLPVGHPNYVCPLKNT
jgi:hypothetical protein